MEPPAAPVASMFLGPIDSPKLERAFALVTHAAECVLITVTQSNGPQITRLPDNPGKLPVRERLSVTPTAALDIVAYISGRPELRQVIIDDAYLLQDLHVCVSCLWFLGRQAIVVSEDRSVTLEPLPSIVKAQVHCIVHHCPATCARCHAPESAIVSSTILPENEPLYSLAGVQRYYSLCYACFRQQQTRLVPCVLPLAAAAAQPPPPTELNNSS